MLLVDDDPGAIQLMGGILTNVAGLRFATNGKDALRLAGELVPDLILLDAEMPGMSGFQIRRPARGRSRARSRESARPCTRGRSADAVRERKRRYRFS